MCAVCRSSLCARFGGVVAWFWVLGFSSFFWVFFDSLPIDALLVNALLVDVLGAFVLSLELLAFPVFFWRGEIK